MSCFPHPPHLGSIKVSTQYCNTIGYFLQSDFSTSTRAPLPFSFSPFFFSCAVQSFCFRPHVHDAVFSACITPLHFPTVTTTNTLLFHFRNPILSLLCFIFFSDIVFVPISGLPCRLQRTLCHIVSMLSSPNPPQTGSRPFLRKVMHLDPLVLFSFPSLSFIYTQVQLGIQGPILNIAPPVPELSANRSGHPPAPLSTSVQFYR